MGTILEVLTCILIVLLDSSFTSETQCKLSVSLFGSDSQGCLFISECIRNKDLNTHYSWEIIALINLKIIHNGQPHIDNN